MHRAKQELDSNDITLAIILSAVAVEGQMAYLFFKWRKVDSFSFEMAPEWEKEWADMRSIGKRMDELSKFLTGVNFDRFAQGRKALLESVSSAASYNPAMSLRDFFQEQFFEKRNRVVHYGEIDLQDADGQQCLMMASSLVGLLNAMDEQRIAKMDEGHEKALNHPSASAE